MNRVEKLVEIAIVELEHHKTTLESYGNFLYFLHESDGWINIGNAGLGYNLEEVPELPEVYEILKEKGYTNELQ